jgi:hypothetical protein
MDANRQTAIPHWVRDTSLILVEDASWWVALPRTADSARWWGTDTNWCTAEDFSAFEVYERQGPLIIFRKSPLIGLSTKAWQLHAVTGEFRDNQNRRASWKGFLSRHPEMAGKLINGIASLQIQQS